MSHLELLFHVEKWLREKDRLIYRELGAIELELADSGTWLSYDEAAKLSYRPIKPGTQWGQHWRYGWFKAEAEIPELPVEARVVLQLNLGGDSTVYVNGKLAGSRDWQHRDIRLPAETRSGDKYAILAEAYAGHESELPILGKSVLSAIRESWYQFFIDLKVLLQLRNVLEPGSLRVSEIDRGFRKLLAELDWSVPSEEALEQQAERGRGILKPLLDCVNGSTTPRLYMMGQSHLDIAWLWPIEETKRKIARTLSNQLALLEEYPEYQYLQSQPYLFQMTKELYPELYARIKSLVAEGRIVPEGGAWVEPDTSIPSGESLIRQFLYGKKFFQDEFGVDNELLWLPDVFGYSGNLPQIMKKCGIHYFASVKMYQTYDNVVDPFPYNTFAWEGIDGSKVIAHLMDYGDFPNPLDVKYVTSQWNNRVQKEGISTLLSQFGYGDGGGGANRDDLETLRRLDNLEGAPRASIGMPGEFFEDVQQKGLPDAHYVGELYYPAHRGTLTSQAKMKSGNRRGEFALREAEIWSAFASLKGSASYPAEQLDRLWKELLLNQFHDILPGTSIARVHVEADQQFTEVRRSAEQLAATAAAALTAPVSGRWTVLNSLGWSRESIVELPEDIEFVQAVQSYGSKDYAKVSVSALGMASLHTAIVPEAASGLSVTSRVLENKYLKVTLNNWGELTSLYDKETGRDWLSGPSNHFRMFRDQPSRFDAWEIDRRYEEAELPVTGVADISIGAEGPLFASLIVKRTLHNSELEQEIWLEAESRSVEFRTRVDWKETNKLLKVAFDLNLHANEALHEIQFGYVKRPNHDSRPHDADRFEVNQHKWSSMIEGDRCFSILNDSKYGISAKNNSLSLSLLRAATYPDEHADLGVHEFNYAIHCWNAGFSSNPVVKEAYAFNSPLLLVPGEAKTVESLLQCSAENIIIDTIKIAQGSRQEWVARLYECKGMSADCELSTGITITSAVETDMLEQHTVTDIPHANRQLRLSFKPFEVKTIKFG